MYKQQYFNNHYDTDAVLLSPSLSPSSSTSQPIYPALFAEEREEREREGGNGGTRKEEGREKLEDAPYPPVEIWRPPKHKWYQKQIVGKTIGKLFLFVGGWQMTTYMRAAIALHHYKVPRQIARRIIKPDPVVLVVGALCVGVGVYLHCIKYLRDPKAIIKYRKRIFSPTTTFQSVIDEFGWVNLFIIATKEELCYKLYQEMQSVRGLYQICSVYKVNNLRAYLKYDVMRAIDVEARWEYDVSRAAEGSGPELGIVVQECGEFLLTASRMQADKIRESLEKDPTMVAYTFVDIFTKFDSSIRRIFKKGFITTAFLRQKLMSQLNTDPSFKFSLIAKHRWVVDILCTPQEIALAFRAARENCPCIVTFLELYWTWPIETYQTLIIPDELELCQLRQIHDESQAFCVSIHKDVSHASKRYNENIAEARRTKEKKIANVKKEANKQVNQIYMHPPKVDSILELVNEIYRKQAEEIEGFDEEERAVQRREKQAIEDKERSAERNIEAKKISLHKEWRLFLSQRRFSSPPHFYSPTPDYSYATPSAPPM